MRPRPYAVRIAARELLRQLTGKAYERMEHADVKLILQQGFERHELIVESVPSILNDPNLAGRLFAPDRLVELSTRYSPQSQRFTAAHELGHFLLHTESEQFCDREPTHGDGERPYCEIEADMFAAEFLLPGHVVEQIFLSNFGARIAGTAPNRLLSDAVAAIHTRDESWTPQTLASAPSRVRASQIAALPTYGGRFFTSLADMFGVSRTAMGIRLLNLGLVT